MLAFLTDPDADAAMHAFAAALAADGVRLAGALRVPGDPGTTGREMRLRLLGDGAEVIISQNLGPGAQGCRLDAAALEDVVARAGVAMASARLLIVNRFGRSEAEGRGFRTLIGQAVSDERPVLLALRPAFLGAFHDFVGDMGTELPADPAALRHWWDGLHACAGQGA